MQYSLTLLAFAAAIKANPVAIPLAVTAAISATAASPPGCTPARTGRSFGIAVQNATTSTVEKRDEDEDNAGPDIVGTIVDDLLSDFVSDILHKRNAPATEFTDGQVQAPTYATASVISDGQVQAGIPTTTAQPVAQIADGQVQAGTHTTTALAVAQIADGQIQAHTTAVAPITQLSDGQPQTPTNTPSSSIIIAVSQISDAQVQVPTTAIAPTPTVTEPAIFQATDAQVSEATPASSLGDVQVVTCETEGGLVVTLENGILKDAKGRTGYIASNFQFQFDDPPQSGAIYTSGFSTCSNGTLALGGSNIFYQCLSGDFYNLYDRSWAAQCSPVFLNAVDIVPCA